MGKIYDVQRRDPSYPPRSVYAWKMMAVGLPMDEAVGIVARLRGLYEGARFRLVDVDDGAVVRVPKSKAKNS